MQTVGEMQRTLRWFIKTTALAARLLRRRYLCGYPTACEVGTSSWFPAEGMDAVLVANSSRCSRGRQPAFRLRAVPPADKPSACPVTGFTFPDWEPTQVSFRGL